MLFRLEQPEDRAAIRCLVIAAFEQSALAYHGEADLVDQIRSSYPTSISIVAVEGTKTVGHIITSPAQLETRQGGIFGGAAIGPVSVDPAFQRRGIGGELVRQSIEREFARASNFVAVAGHPDYYPRFGFKNISTWGISHCFQGMRDELFFIRLSESMASIKLEGTKLRYCTEFGAQTN